MLEAPGLLELEKHCDAGAASVRQGGPREGPAGAEARFEQNRATPCYAPALGLGGAQDVVTLLRLHVQPAAFRRTLPKPGAGTGEWLAGENLAGSDLRGEGCE